MKSSEAGPNHLPANLTKAQKLDNFLNQIMQEEKIHQQSQQQDLLRFAFAAYKANDIKNDFKNIENIEVMGYPSLGTTIFNPTGELFIVNKNRRSAFNPQDAQNFLVNMANHIYEKRLDKKSKKVAVEIVSFVKTIRE